MFYVHTAGNYFVSVPLSCLCLFWICLPRTHCVWLYKVSTEVSRLVSNMYTPRRELKKVNTSKSELHWMVYFSPWLAVSALLVLSATQESVHPLLLYLNPVTSVPETMLKGCGHYYTGH